MEIIKPLSEAVESSVRSGFIISGLTAVAEELIYNSLDAGATKVSVSVIVNSGYVKVEDDGCGISRDGLVLLGERYVTSRLHHFHEKDDVRGSFGFRGEVLCSIADISLIEIVTKVHGMPNGYRKVMKGRNCLYLGIDDDRKDVGTTVIVRDLFYNHPVRRRQMQTSAKKILHSVKKCAVRIALVHPKVSFKVMDKESEDELLRTHASSSSLSVLCSSFGIQASSLHELSTSKGLLKLTGYVSGPFSSFSSKAIQYIYVNSRFVVKGPIHKVLNRLADIWDQSSGENDGKRGQPHAGPTYCLNLTCPRSYYDLDLGCSGTSVEFKDWIPVLAFIEKSVAPFWSKETKKGELDNCEADQIKKIGTEKEVENKTSEEKDWWLKTCEISAKRRRILKNEDEQEDNKAIPCLLFEDHSDLSLWQGIGTQGNTVKIREPKTERVFPYQSDSSKSGDIFSSDHMFYERDGIGNHLWEPDMGLMSLSDNLLENDVAVEIEDNYGDGFLSSSRWKDELRVGDACARNNEIGSGCSFEFVRGNQRNKTTDDGNFLQNGSWENLVQIPLNYEKKSSFGSHNFKAKRSSSDFVSNGDANDLSQNFDIFQRDQCQNEVPNTSFSPKLNIESEAWNDLDMSSMRRRDSLSFYGGSFDKELTPEPLSEGVFSSSCLWLNSVQHSPISYPFFNMKSSDIGPLIQHKGLQWRPEARNYDDFEQSNDERDEFYLDDLANRCSSYEKIPFANCSNSATHFKCDYTDAKRGIFFSSRHSVDDISSVRHGDVFFKETYSPVKDRRGEYRHSPSVCWSPSTFKRKVQMDVQRCQAVGWDNIPRGQWDWYSPDCLLSARYDDILADETFSPYLDFGKKLSTYAPSISIEKGPKINLQEYQVLGPKYRSSEQLARNSVRLRRSHSAPPTYRGKRRFLSVKNCFQGCINTERGELKQSPGPSPFYNEHPQHHETSSVKDSPCCVERKVKETSNVAQTSSLSQDDKTQNACCSPGYLKRVQDSESPRTKWRKGCQDTRLEDIVNYQSVGEGSNQLKDETTILDIHSCMLQLSGDSLVPKSINRNCLERAKVLLQVDNKFIPVVASGTLAVIDQHAADERIRLEEMRKKVISGEMKSVTYLEEEKELVLPEMAYQLLCNYIEHIQHWGWICNIFSQDSRSFAKNLNLLNGKPTRLTVLAVPCILGVNLSDADLMEFLEQLADTDGSSTIPPSVLRVLNYKACRGAIMFGDKLLPSECSLIVEELKQTSLCFQCAHGRPTTVPLVNLRALHKGIAHLEPRNEASKDSWHGLSRKEINISRAKHRLDVARGG